MSTGPKSYAYKVCDANGKHLDTILKNKGFALNYCTSAHLNFETMKAQVFQFRENGDTLSKAVTVYQNVIRRTKMHKLETRTERKVQQLVYKKRVLQQDFTTLPFGY